MKKRELVPWATIMLQRRIILLKEALKSTRPTLEQNKEIWKMWNKCMCHTVNKKVMSSCIVCNGICED